MRLGAREQGAGLALLAAAWLSGCGFGQHLEGSGHSIEESRTMPVFDRLDVEDGIPAHVQVDPTRPHSVLLVGDDNLIARMRTDHDGDRLRVHFGGHDSVSWDSPNPLRVEVVVPSLEALERSGGGRMDVSGGVDANHFTVSVSGGGAVLVHGLRAESVALSLSGGAYALLEGEARQVRMDLSGGSEVYAGELASREAQLESSGGGAASLRVSETLRVSASGGSHVRILGRPEVLERDLSGGSTLTFE
ncbi:head GIN domain-containing protein [Myxococcus fulvus]|uniref:head GIN domain-containing protein n=1 Tax=Myxococcus fulvus TaxID=33 RepID=UPI003B9C3629